VSHPNKVKGTRWESEVVDYLVEQGFTAVERRSLKGNADQGDLVGVPGWTLECKNEARINLAGYMAEGEAEAKNAGTDLFAAIVKRRRKGTAAAYAVMPLELFVKIARIVNGAA
jgi:Holliday junction resolvase